MRIFTNKVFIAFFLVCGISIGLFSQTTTGKSKKLFQDTFNEYVEMLDGKREISLKRAVFTYLKEPNALNNHQPYAYDFEDFSGQKDFSKMFVTKLLRTKKGNCLSFPLLYEILCDELGAKSYLALAPNRANLEIYKECVNQMNSLGYSEMSDEQYDELMKNIENEKDK
jgi:hypothetical protein